MFGGYEAVRYVHFFAMAAIAGFLLLHILFAVIFPKNLRAIILDVEDFSCPPAQSSARCRPEASDQGCCKLMPDPARRQFLRGAASLGALAVLTGCDIVDGVSAEHALSVVSRFNDGVQAWLFDPNKLAPTYPESAITRPFPFNAYYPEDDAPEVDGTRYRLEVGGLVDDKRSWSLDGLYALPQEKQITRHVCVEGWSAIGSWTGTRLSDFLRRVGADTRAKYVWFQCAEGYSNTIDMATAASADADDIPFDNEILPVKYGFR